MKNNKYDKFDLVRSIKDGNIKDSSFSKRGVLKQLYYDLRDRFNKYGRRKKELTYIYIQGEHKMAKLKDLVKENFSLVGGVVSTPAINAGYGSLSQIVKEKYGESSETQKVSSEQVKGSFTKL